MKILRVYFRDAIFHDSKMSLDAEQHKAEFELTTAGVIVVRNDSGKHGPKLVPWSNIKDCDIELDAKPAKK